jgi:hypothetical protein
VSLVVVTRHLRRRNANGFRINVEHSWTDSHLLRSFAKRVDNFEIGTGAKQRRHAGT